MAAKDAWARAADCSARMPSAGEASATDPSVLPVDGSLTSKLAPISASTRVPPCPRRPAHPHAAHSRLRDRARLPRGLTLGRLGQLDALHLPLQHDPAARAERAVRPHPGRTTGGTPNHRSPTRRCSGPAGRPCLRARHRLGLGDPRRGPAGLTARTRPHLETPWLVSSHSPSSPTASAAERDCSTRKRPA